MPFHNWIEPDRHTTAAEAVPHPLPKVVLLKRSTKGVRDAVGKLLPQEGI